MDDDQRHKVDITPEDDPGVTWPDILLVCLGLFLLVIATVVALDALVKQWGWMS